MIRKIACVQSLLLYIRGLQYINLNGNKRENDRNRKIFLQNVSICTLFAYLYNSFCVVYLSPFVSYWNSKKCIKLKLPTLCTKLGTYDVRVCNHYRIMYILLQSIHFFFQKTLHTILNYLYMCCEWLTFVEHKQCSIFAKCSLERVVKIWKCLRVIGAIAWPISVYWVKVVAWVNCTDTQLFAFTWETQEIRASCVQSPNSEKDSHYAMRRKIQFWNRFTNLSLEVNHIDFHIFFDKNL